MPIQGGVPERREVLCGVAAKDRATVLIERRIAHVMHAVFEGAPMVTDEGEQLVRVGVVSRQGRDVVGRFGFALAVFGSLAHDATNLLHAGPVDVVVQRGRGRDGSLLLATVVLVQRVRGLLFSSSRLVAVRGPVFKKRKTVPPVRR